MRRWALAIAFLSGVVAAGAFWRREVRALVARAKPYVRKRARVDSPALIINRWSGDGRAERVGLADAARSAGVRVIMPERGDDLTQLAHDAISAGADAIGMAGGDGSLGLVATVAIERGVPFFCVPVGTRNHFALDLGLDRDDPLLAWIDRWEPAFLAEVETIVDEMESVGSRVSLVTLPGLFVEDREPSDRALEMGHLPEGTDNPFVLARLTERTNDALRSLAKRRGLQIIDLASWSHEALEPRDEYFFDSVHLWEHGQSEIGRHLAGHLHGKIPAFQASAP